MTGEFRAYGEYKESGLSWLGRVPKHWGIRRIKTLMREIDKRSASGTEAPLLSMTRLRGLVRQADATNKLHAATTLVGYKVCHPGDVVMNRMQAWSGMFHVAHEEGLVSPDYATFKPLDGIESEYLGHLLRSPQMVAKFHAESKGIGSGFLRLYGDRLGAIHTAIAPQEEQRTIIAFIASVDRKVHRFIRNRRRLIEVLNEQKHAIINHAVTRGLDPTVSLKRSGIDWLGEIPEHWELRRNKTIFRERIESGADGLPVLVVSLRTGVTVGEEMDERGRPKRLIEDRAKYKRTYCGDIAYNMMRLWQGAVGAVPVDGLVSPAYVVAAPLERIVPQFFEYLFRTPAYMGSVNRESRGIVSDRNRTYWDDFKTLVSPMPPTDEQAAIVGFIGTETSTLSDAIGKAQREIDLIREYRTRLIADVVTGKLDVRHLAPPEPSPADEPADAELGEAVDDEGVPEADELEHADETANE